MIEYTAKLTSVNFGVVYGYGKTDAHAVADAVRNVARLFGMAVSGNARLTVYTEDKQGEVSINYVSTYTNYLIQINQP